MRRCGNCKYFKTFINKKNGQWKIICEKDYRLFGHKNKDYNDLNFDEKKLKNLRKFLKDIRYCFVKSKCLKYL